MFRVPRGWESVSFFFFFPGLLKVKDIFAFNFNLLIFLSMKVTS